MKVYLIGKTQEMVFDSTDHEFAMPGKARGSDFEARAQYELDSGQLLIEFAGRLCYESVDLPNPKTADNSGYIRNIISLHHESVLEHVSVTFYVEGVSRNLSHELIRHRHLSFSELSQRYVNMEDANVVIPPANGGGTRPLPKAHKGAYGDAVETLTQEGFTRKQAREAARYGLPAGTETKFVVTGNLRAWRDVLKKRHSEFADAEMQKLAAELLIQLSIEYPDVFADIKKESK